MATNCTKNIGERRVKFDNASAATINKGCVEDAVMDLTVLRFDAPLKTNTLRKDINPRPDIMPKLAADVSLT